MNSSNGFWIFWTGFSLFWMVLVAYLTISIYLTNQQEYELLSAEGVWVQGRLLDKWEEITYDDDDDGGSTTSYYVKVEFTVPEEASNPTERRMELTDSIPYYIYESLEKGGRINIIYAQSNPEIYRIEAEFVPPNEYDVFAACCPPFFGLPFLLLGLWGLKYAR